ncbi:1-acyl-sn-glycerol-3-phosphate acyltransferase [Acetobacter nitrogenifigens DSM 23921 = NBRC 105050]|uniref:1-acyl-sn-glycerol-3-phosphate acyltransferase n=1 Tax=Acetobacter nitrogenifigens DSM 23921 = NBRC 105050 TaxID=1120919 RepID=A0A511X640_9PROT|nr:lysophospholipid acyltransferase family protein [Acetobacter nitrogenifigens]GBQ96223.1 1-acyl-sn-glycerol-3-phosphate acyltransferase [Acetobacter nitrogenifigens DSM 23921 = NBRC 105050]GEN58402.1 1-acyl-sn-glycerol-3-phosphate acyltransferase [Acetobacter nitrogenifigens DSM 23921 = NBRC 105050]
MILLRSTAYSLYLVALTIVMGVLAFPIRLFAARLALPYAKLWCRLLIGGLRVLCGTTFRVEGLQRLPADGAFLIASQHQSAFDTLVWMTLLPKPAYVMKQELTRIPLVGPMLLLTGMVPVERGARSKAMRSLLKETAKAAANGRQIIIFPEGTRVAPGEIVSLKPGVAAVARHASLPVYPVATDSGRYWGRKGFLKRPGVISIVIGKKLEVEKRGDLLGEIRTAWRAGERRFDGETSGEVTGPNAGD